MLKKTALQSAVVVSLLLAACAVRAGATEASEFAYEEVLSPQDIEGALENTRLNEILQQYLALLQTYDPERATLLGVHTTDSQLTQRTPERFAKQIESLKRLREKLHQVNMAAMPPAMRVDYLVLDRQLEAEAYELEKTDTLRIRPQYYLEPIFSTYQLLVKDFGPYNQRAADALNRLNKIPLILEQGQRNLSHTPKIWAEQAIRQSSETLNNMYELVEQFRTYTRYDPVLKSQADETLARLKAALTEYRDFLKKDILPYADGDFRAGKDAYTFFLEKKSGLNMSAGAALRYAKKNFKAAKKDLEREALSIDILHAKEKGWQGVLEKLPKQHPAYSEVLKVFQDQTDRAYQHFDDYKVVEFPRQRLVFKRMPAFMASVLPSLWYSAPFSLDSVRVAELYLTLPQEQASEAAKERILSGFYNNAQIELLTAFAVMPGMHLRSYAADSSRSKIRKISQQPLIINGWASYAELLAEEKGYYTTYWSRFLRIYVRALRCARAYADVALHTKELTSQETAEFLQSSLSMSKAQAENEVLRISLAPGEAFSYTLGMDKILDLRKRYAHEEGQAFNLRKFHTVFLKQGAIAFPDLEAELWRLQKEQKYSEQK